jgi:hypothetical protein
MLQSNLTTITAYPRCLDPTATADQALRSAASFGDSPAVADTAAAHGSSIKGIALRRADPLTATPRLQEASGAAQETYPVRRCSTHYV